MPATGILTAAGANMYERTDSPDDVGASSVLLHGESKRNENEAELVVGHVESLVRQPPPAPLPILFFFLFATVNPNVVIMWVHRSKQEFRPRPLRSSVPTMLKSPCSVHCSILVSPTWKSAASTAFKGAKTTLSS
jgi:hypothetical protein